MPSDLQSVEKQLAARSHELLPRKCWKLVFLVSECVRSLSKIYLGVFPASPGTRIQEISVRTFSIQWGQTRSKRPIGSKKPVFFRSDPRSQSYFPHLDRESAHGDFLQLLEKPETPPDRSWRELRHILRRTIPIFIISGSKAHASVLEGTFSTDCASDGIRTGLVRRGCSADESFPEWYIVVCVYIQRWR